jgi:hypothetical protein
VGARAGLDAVAEITKSVSHPYRELNPGLAARSLVAIHTVSFLPITCSMFRHLSGVASVAPGNKPVALGSLNTTNTRLSWSHSRNVALRTDGEHLTV